MVDVAPQNGATLREPHRFRRTASANDGAARHHPAVLAITQPGIPGGTRNHISPAGRACIEQHPEEAQKRPDPYSGFAHLPVQDTKPCQQLEHFTGSKFLWRHDHGTRTANISTTDPMISSGNVRRPWGRRCICTLPTRLHLCRCWRDTMCWCGRCGVRGVETGSHALRIISSGVFHRYPKASSCSAISAKRCLSSFGALTAVRNRMAGTCRSRRRNTSRRISGSLSPGMYDAAPLHCSLDRSARDRVMFSADYPFLMRKGPVRSWTRRHSINPSCGYCLQQRGKAVAVWLSASV